MVLKSEGEKLFHRISYGNIYVLILIIQYNTVEHTFSGNTQHFRLLIIKPVIT